VIRNCHARDICFSATCQWARIIIASAAGVFVDPRGIEPTMSEIAI
jgi:hypothetical protein